MKINLRVVLSLLMCVCLLSACSQDVETDGENTAPDVSEQLTAEELELPDGKFLDGDTFNMYHCHGYFDYYDVKDPASGNLMHEAVIQRNEAVEERTGVKLNHVHTPTPQDQGANRDFIASLILAGDTTYDAFVHVQHTGMPGLINEGMFVDWNKLPHIDFSKPWWYSNAIRDISFGDKVFAMTGDYNLPTFAVTECLAFNKDLMDELELEYPYQHVFEGTWTHDKFVEYIQAATKDLNGDGQMDYDNDRYGFGGWQYEQVQALYVGYGGQTLIKDDFNLPKLNIYSEQQNRVIDKMIEVFENTGAFYHGSKYGLEDTMFKEGRLLFNDSFLNFVPGMRNYDIEVGFVPYPKLSEEQENYYSRTANISCLTYIPITLSEERYETVGGALEAMAYYSSKLVLPTYFDTILTVQSTRDVESEQMIPIIKDSCRFMDMAIGFSPEQFVYGGQNTLASHWASTKTTYEEKLKTLVQTYSE